MAAGAALVVAVAVVGAGGRVLVRIEEGERDDRSAEAGKAATEAVQTGERALVAPGLLLGPRIRELRHGINELAVIRSSAGD